MTASDAKVVRCEACDTKNRVPRIATGVPQCASCHQPLPWLVDATDLDFDKVTSGRLPVLVDMWAPWCGPCRMVAPAVEQAATELAGRLKVVKVNVDNAPQVATRHDALSIPTLLILRDQAVVARQVGALPQDQLLAWARSHAAPATH